MKKLLLSTMAALIIISTQAQAPCDSLNIIGSQSQAIISVNTSSLPSLIDYWFTTAVDGTVLAEDSMSTTQNIYNFTNPSSGLIYDTIITCLHTINTICCVTYVWNGNAWIALGGNPAPSWDCPTNMPGGCYDPGNGLGQYSSFVACQAVCGVSTASWDCGSQGCYDPGTGLGQYSSLVACQAVCVSTVSTACDSMTLVSTGGSPQTMLAAEVPINFMDIYYWITTAPDGTVLGEDSMWNSHQIYNNLNNGQPYDTINICITYLDNSGYSTCCVIWVWNGLFWARISSVTSVGEIGSFEKKLIKVVDVLGREASINSNQTIFLIYEDGTIEKRCIIK